MLLLTSGSSNNFLYSLENVPVQNHKKPFNRNSRIGGPNRNNFRNMRGMMNNGRNRGPPPNFQNNQYNVNADVPPNRPPDVKKVLINPHFKGNIQANNGMLNNYINN